MTWQLNRRSPRAKKTAKNQPFGLQMISILQDDLPAIEQTTTGKAGMLDIMRVVQETGSQIGELDMIVIETEKIETGMFLLEIETI